MSDPANRESAPPLEITALGPEVIRTSSDDKLKSQPLSRAKLILVGPGGAGKTSLARCLVGHSFDEAQSVTQGVEITSWATNIDPTLTLRCVRLPDC